MRVGSVSYCTRQGISIMMKEMHDAGLVTDPVVMGHSRPGHPGWYPWDTPQVHRKTIDGPEIDEWIARIDVALFIETAFDWSLPDRVRAAGKRTVMIPMHEWTLREPRHRFDLMICPSRLDLDYFSEGLPPETIPTGTSSVYRGRLAAVGRVYRGNGVHCDRAAYLPFPVPQDWWQPRTRADRWLHSAGNVGWGFHKGTVELLRAVPLVKNRDWRLTVRAQDADALGKAMREAGWRGDPRVTVDVTDDTANLPREWLYDGFDVLVAPERYNGLSLPLQEARAAGLLVVTTDRYPANTWLPSRISEEGSPSPLIKPVGYERGAVSDSYLDFLRAKVDPADVAAKIDELCGADIEAYSRSAVKWNEENSWNTLKPLYEKALTG